jgi:hypothetical protein
MVQMAAPGPSLMKPTKETRKLAHDNKSFKTTQTKLRLFLIDPSAGALPVGFITAPLKFHDELNDINLCGVR